MVPSLENYNPSIGGVIGSTGLGKVDEVFHKLPDKDGE